MGLIHLIRHAPPAVKGIFLGRLDPPLESETLSPSSIEPASIFTSPLRRAHRTAESLFPDREIIVIQDLAECGFGDWEGKTWNEIQILWPELAARKSANWCAVTPPGGEPWDDFVIRVRRAWNQIRSSAAPVAVVSHAAVNSVLAYLIAGRDPLAFNQDYCEVVSFEAHD